MCADASLYHRSSDGLDPRRRKALFRSRRRGIREMDLVLGAFADETIHALTDAELADYEALLDVQDVEILSWITGASDVPADHDTELLARILATR